MNLPSSASPARRILAAGAVGVALVAAGCGSSSSGSPSSGGGGSTAKSPNPNAPETSPAGDIPDNQAYVRYAPPQGGYSVKVPEGWARSTANGATTFTDKLNSITMQTRPAVAAPTIKRAGREISTLAKSTRGFHAGAVTTVKRRAGSAIRITYTAAGRPNAVTGKAVTDAVERYVFFHNGKDVILTLSGPKGADNVDPWRIVTDSVAWPA